MLSGFVGGKLERIGQLDFVVERWGDLAGGTLEGGERGFLPVPVPKCKEP